VDLFSARASDIDAVLLDTTLPGMSRLEVFKEIRRVNADAKVILTGAYDGERLNTSATSAGQLPQGFIWKPHRLLEVVRVLRDALCEGSSKAHDKLKAASSSA
jgi:DNA-binding NtrC family response regulator